MQTKNHINWWYAQTHFVMSIDVFVGCDEWVARTLIVRVYVRWERSGHVLEWCFNDVWKYESGKQCWKHKRLCLCYEMVLWLNLSSYELNRIHLENHQACTAIYHTKSWLKVKLYIWLSNKNHNSVAKMQSII